MICIALIKIRLNILTEIYIQTLSLYKEKKEKKPSLATTTKRLRPDDPRDISAPPAWERNEKAPRAHINERNEAVTKNTHNKEDERKRANSGCLFSPLSRNTTLSLMGFYDLLTGACTPGGGAPAGNPSHGVTRPPGGAKGEPVGPPGASEAALSACIYVLTRSGLKAKG